MVVLFKEIKPQKLKEKALRLELLNAIRKAGTQIKKDFEATTRTWEHKPKFEILISLRHPPGPTILVATDDKIYRFVNEGTRPHPIFAGIYTSKSRKKVLAFPSVSVPKTKPGSLSSGPGRKSGGTILRPYVQHPGTEARKFDQAVKKKRKTWFKRQMEKAMRTAAKKSGHGI